MIPAALRSALSLGQIFSGSITCPVPLQVLQGFVVFGLLIKLPVLCSEVEDGVKQAQDYRGRREDNQQRDDCRDDLIECFHGWK